MSETSLGQTLMSLWLKYEYQFYLARKKASATRVHRLRVHRLRVAVRRTEAALVVINTLIADEGVGHLLRELKKTRRVLGPLRNAQVKKRILTKKDSADANRRRSKHLVHYLSSQITQAKKKSRRFLRKTSFLKQQRLFNRIERKLLKLEGTKRSSEIQNSLSRTLKKGRAALEASAKKITPEDITSIHRCRILTKRFRYQKEYVNLVRNRSDDDLAVLKTLQERERHTAMRLLPTLWRAWA